MNELGTDFLMTAVNAVIFSRRLMPVLDRYVIIAHGPRASVILHIPRAVYALAVLTFMDSEGMDITDINQNYCLVITATGNYAASRTFNPLDTPTISPRATIEVTDMIFKE